MKNNGKLIDTRDRVIEILSVESGVGVEDMTDEKSFDELGFDSIDVIEVAMALEEQFDIKEGILDDRLELVTTVGDLVKIVEEHKGGK